MLIATLIAAGRLDDRLVKRALARLPAAQFGGWIEEGDAADLKVEGDPAVIRAALESLGDVDVAVQAGPRPAYRLFVADMDSTIIGQECIDELADYAGVKAEVAAITARAMAGELDFSTALAERVGLLAGLDEATIDRCLAERVRPNPGAATLVATLRSRGIDTLLVSGGFAGFVAPIAEQLGFDAFEANALGADRGRLTGRTEGMLVDAHRKRAAAAERLADRGWDDVALVAIGDGANDIPLVQLAGLGVGYRPKPALAAVADGVIRHHNLTALLWAMGIPRSGWVTS